MDGVGLQQFPDHGGTNATRHTGDKDAKALLLRHNFQRCYFCRKGIYGKGWKVFGRRLLKGNGVKGGIDAAVTFL
jgi:hypothetical protein